MTARSLDTLRWESRLLALPEPFYARVAAEALESPYLVSFNPAAAELLGLDPAAAGEADFVRAIAGGYGQWRAPTRWRCATAATSSASMCRSSATGAR